MTSIETALGVGAGEKIGRKKRHELILASVHQSGFAEIELLARRCRVSTQTIRRDIQELSDQGQVTRHHGGVGVPSTKLDATFEVRRFSGVETKRRLGLLVADLIPERSSLFIAGGSTMEIVAQCLQKKTDLMVVTNNLHAALTLQHRPNFDVLVPGGKIRNSTGTLIGEDAIRYALDFHMDYLIMSTGGIMADGTMLEFDHHVTGILKTMMSQARRIIVVADKSKFGREGAVCMGNLADIWCLVTNAEPPAETVALLERNNVRLVMPDGGMTP